MRCAANKRSATYCAKFSVPTRITRRFEHAGPSGLTHARFPCEAITMSQAGELETASSEFDCVSCGACCYQRPGTILVSSNDLVRWRRIGRQDILDQLEEGHFGQDAFKMGSHGACVHH